MKKYTTLTALLMSVLVVAGCLNTGGDATRPDASNATVGGDVTTAVAVNEAGTAGDAVHKVTSVEYLDEIPESYTLPEWDIIKKATPADEGYQWVHITGEVTNNGSSTDALDSTNVFVRDTNGNEYSVSTDTTIYVDSDKSPVYIDLQPGQTKPWEGYFLVPVGATDLVLVANDLSFLPESEVVVDISVPTDAMMEDESMEDDSMDGDAMTDTMLEGSEEAEAAAENPSEAAAQ